MGEKCGDNKVKRKYSRNGCTECKKRRMKCDETKPICWTCQRLSRNCVYILNNKNKKRRPKTEKTHPTKSDEEQDQRSSSTSEAPLDEDKTISHLIPNSTFSSLDFSATDASLIFRDLNDIVNAKLEDALTPNLKTYIEENSNPFTNEFNDDFSNANYGQEITFNISLESFNLGEPHDRFMESYYSNFSTLMSPLMPDIGLNPIRDVLLSFAKKEPYLLYAILACGAKVSHRETSLMQDDQAYCTYLSSCLNILSDNFLDDNLIIEKIEPMLLTILILIGHCASNKNLRWRAHLKGAKELFKKTFHVKTSDTLNFCRNWLITYEILAGLTNFYGGIFQTNDVELDNFINNDPVYLNSLKKLHMIDIHGFNYISGHIVELDVLCKDIIKVLNRIRRLRVDGILKKGESYMNYRINPPVATGDEIYSILRRLTDLEDQAIIDKSGIIPPENPNHPINTDLFENFHCIETLKFADGDVVTYSWYDISHQSHCLAAKIVLLNKVLEVPSTSILIQSLVNKGLNFISFLNKMSKKEFDDYTNFSFTHLHFPIAIIGKHCVEQNQQKLVEKYLDKISIMGLASAKHNLDKFKLFWNNGLRDEEEEEDVLTW